MAKKCLVCGGKIGLFSKHLTVADGPVCLSCASEWGVQEALDAGIHLSDINAIFSPVLLNNIDSATRELRTITELRSSFEKTFAVSELALFDDVHRLLLLADQSHMSYKPEHYTLVRYNEIVAFDLLEDGDSVSQGGLGRAVAGGLLFGPVGAIVGGSTGKKRTKSTCKSMQIELTLSNPSRPTLYVKLITAETKTDSFSYRMSFEHAQEILSKLQAITNEPQASTPSQGTDCEASLLEAGNDPVAELRRFKALLDEGILTQEEFDAKKRQILNG